MRLSRSQFNYSFLPLQDPNFFATSSTQLLIPLFSSLTHSSMFNPTNFILLYSFTASLTTDAENTKAIFREYVVNMDDSGRLNLSFTPSQPKLLRFHQQNQGTFHANQFVLHVCKWYGFQAHGNWHTVWLKNQHCTRDRVQNQSGRVRNLTKKRHWFVQELDWSRWRLFN